ncbi:MAG: hypothetical protein EBY18_23820 [Alphaproteobacteria bacterium]|nr:hypothetical protein [Alphaproteobacteria bacterium]
MILILALLPLYVAAFLACSALFGEQSIFKSANDLLEAPAILVRPGLEGASATQWASVVVATGLLIPTAWVIDLHAPSLSSRWM